MASGTYSRIALSLTLALSLGTAAYAADMPGNSPNTPASNYGSKAKSTANASNGSANSLQARWTDKDLKTFCHSRYGADDMTYGYKSCLSRNAGKIGHDETLGDIQELNAAKNAGL